MPPCSRQDFMVAIPANEYLVYVSHDAENLQFWLWYEDYSHRFFAASKCEQALSPPWYKAEVPRPQSNDSNQTGATVFDRENPVKTGGALILELRFDHVHRPSSLNFSHLDTQSLASTTSTTLYRAESVEDADTQMGLKCKSFTIQPFRSEMNRVISHYLNPGSSRELNLSSKDRAAVLHALEHTTHPSALAFVKDMVEASLRGQSHPNFIRWAICNGNKPRVLFVRNSGIAHIVAAIILGVLLSLSHASRWWRFFVFPLFFVGFDIGVAAYKGLCVIIHTSHRRALRPWEQVSEDASLTSFDGGPEEEANLSTDNMFSMATRRRNGVSLDTFGTSNSYSHELWVDKYKKKHLFQKIFTKSIWVQESAMRLLQDKIVKQSHAWALIISVLLTALVVALPQANLI
ncbi:MAG: hypothetical protein ALECFALPRED_001215 [Alectoria fallacina]|uniref:RGS domain-containing protein n=1 Tax=Alectoria fallacina TaxID=1903189 RepID=A0A8H3I974_9LECA|nr:MAG: hypothetical protein ALECFALPRED_001215 [Alectoria fallacina]